MHNVRVVVRERIARSVATVVLVILALGCLAFVAAYFVNRATPFTWGTYTETASACGGVGRFRQCILTGTWVSQDGSQAVTGLTLDQRFAPTGRISAGYRDGGIFTDQGLVLTRDSSQMTPGPWIGLAAAGVCGFGIRKCLRSRPSRSPVWV